MNDPHLTSSAQASSRVRGCRWGNGPPERPILATRNFLWRSADTTDASNPFLELTHQTRDDREGDRIVRDRIRLIWTVPTYGGRRWWFQCPRTGRRTTKLFLPNGGWHFWSRQAYGLGYACQREDRLGRLQRRAAKLNRQLGGDGWAGWDTPRSSRNGCAGEPTSGDTKPGSERSRKPTRSLRCAPRAF
jgi:hypothetical protein